LSREPDPDGLDGWTGTLKRCASDSPCFNTARIKVVRAFFDAPETQVSAFFVYRLYVAVFGRTPQFAEFLSDRQQLATYCHNDWSDLEQIVAGQRIFLDEWLRRESFRTAYPETLTPEEFVNRLFDTAELKPFIFERTQQTEALRAGRKEVKCSAR